MMIVLFQAFVLALSLCADCFAVSTCSGVTLGNISFKKIFTVAIVFAIVQSAFLFIGWALGDLVADWLSGFAKVIGFLLVNYVGVSMLRDALSGEHEVRNLSGLRNVFIGAAATSIDAFAVGVSLSMDRLPFLNAGINTAAVFAVTFASVALGIAGGSRIGARYGRKAEIVGGLVLIVIGVNILL